MIGILNYGLGNVGSIQNMIKKIGEINVFLIDSPQYIFEADKIILPGVGSFDTAMELLEGGKWISAINEFVLVKGKPVLGICLGMQLLGKTSEEGKKDGLGLMNMKTVRFNDMPERIPHMGWDYITINKKDNLVVDIPLKQRYYFVHSYHVICDDMNDILMTCNYGYPFAAAISNNNIYGTQFHPEKSHLFGMKLLKNFVEGC